VGETILTAAITAVVTTAIVTLVQNSWPWIKARFAARRPDHKAIWGGWYKLDDGHGWHFHVSVGCAPSLDRGTRRLPDVAVAVAFIEAVFPEVPSSARYITQEHLRFEPKTEDPHAEPPAVVLYDTGLIEAHLQLESTPDAEGHPLLDLVSIIEPLVRLHRACAAGWYRKLYPRSKGRIDWRLLVTPSINPDSTWTPWRALTFPGREPGGRATEPVAPNPRPWFGEQRLQDQRVTSRPNDVVGAAAQDLLTRAGYFNVEVALADLDKAVSSLAPVEGPRAIPAQAQLRTTSDSG
jgi:hypothetical protein